MDLGIKMNFKRIFMNAIYVASALVLTYWILTKLYELFF